MPPTTPVLVDEKYPDGPPNDMEQFIADYVDAHGGRGDIKAIGIAVVNTDGSIGSAFNITDKQSIALSASVAALERRVARYLDE